MKAIMHKVLPLSLIIGLRFFGLFIVLSVLSQYALTLPGGTAFLAGVALGGYALTQALLQVPFGVLSDRIGRKPTILIGLLLFAAGSAIAAAATDIYWLLLGRFLQGAGAIGSVVVAMIADQVREDERAKAMAVMGMTIAMSFAAAMLIGPVIAGVFDVAALFWLTALLALTALTVLYTAVPEPPKIQHHYSEEEAKVRHVFNDPDLVRMYVTFLFHSSTMAIAFFLIPIVLRQQFHLDPSAFWQVYLPAVIFGILAMGPAAVFGEKYGKGKQIFLISIAMIALAFVIMGFTGTLWGFGIGAVLFFMGFNMFEPLLQSFVSKFARVHQKGAALGVANTFAYVGIFIGGVIGGFLFEHFGKTGVSLFVIALAVVWFMWIFGMRNPGLRATMFVERALCDDAKVAALKGVEGVNDYYINETEGLIVVKYDAGVIDEEEIARRLKR